MVSTMFGNACHELILRKQHGEGLDWCWTGTLSSDRRLDSRCSLVSLPWTPCVVGMVWTALFCALCTNTPINLHHTRIHNLYFTYTHTQKKHLVSSWDWKDVYIRRLTRFHMVALTLYHRLKIVCARMYVSVLGHNYSIQYFELCNIVTKVICARH